MRGLGKPVLHGFYFRFKQWGHTLSTQKQWSITLPISVSESCLALAGDVGLGAYSIGAMADSKTITFYQQFENTTGVYYLVISKA